MNRLISSSLAGSRSAAFAGRASLRRPAFSTSSDQLLPAGVEDASAVPESLVFKHSDWKGVKWNKLKRVQERTVPEMVSNLHKLTRGVCSPSRPVGLHRLLNRVADGEETEDNFEYALRGYRIALHNGVKLDRSTTGLLVKSAIRAGKVQDVLALLADPAKSRLFAGKTTIGTLASYARYVRDSEILAGVEAAALSGACVVAADSGLSKRFISAKLACGDLAGAAKQYAASKSGVAGWSAALSGAESKMADRVDLTAALAEILATVAEGKLPAVEEVYPEGKDAEMPGEEEIKALLAAIVEDAKMVSKAVQKGAAGALPALIEKASSKLQ